MQGIEIKGYKEAVKVLDQLTNQMQATIIRQALRKSAAQMVSAARTRAPKRTGALSRSIRIVTLRRDRVPTTIPIAIAPVFEVTKNDKINAFYARFVHDGTKTRLPRAVSSNKAKGKGGSRVLVFTTPQGGKVFSRSAKGLKPNPFMIDAFNAATGATVDSFGGELTAAIERFVDKNCIQR